MMACHRGDPGRQDQANEKVVSPLLIRRLSMTGNGVSMPNLGDADKGAHRYPTPSLPGHDAERTTHRHIWIFGEGRLSVQDEA